MKVWAVANQKGGVGKTTTTVTLAGLLAQRGYNALAIDLDPHGSLTAYFGHDPDALQNSVYSLFRGPVETRPAVQTLIRPTQFEGLGLLPASTALATLDRQLGAQEGMGLVIGRAVRQLAGQYDHILIDCPPVLGVLMINALAASDHLLVPVQTEFLAIKGLDRMMRTLAMVLRARKRPLPYTIIPTMFDRHIKASLEALQSLRESYPDSLWKSVIPVDTQFREASRQGAPLSHLNPQARGVIAYTALISGLLDESDNGVPSAAVSQS